jgi:two-component system, NtrC family, nitrogen regulation sensor histidine kinase NtrY
VPHIWAIASLCLWCLCLVRFYGHSGSQQPAKMAALVNSDIAAKDAIALQQIADTATLKQLFSQRPTPRLLQRQLQLPFYLYGFEDGILKFWNTNVAVPLHYDSLRSKVSVKYTPSGVYIRRSVTLPYRGADRVVIAYLPVVVRYPVQNDYLVPHFAASPDIPVSTQVLPHANGGKYEYPVKLSDGTTICYLEFDPRDTQRWLPDVWFAVLLFGAFMATLVWLQLLTLAYLKKVSSWLKALLIFSLAIGLKVWLFFFGLPFGLDTLPFFAPSLFASSKYLTSLGDLFIYIALFLWLLGFTFRHTGYKSWFLDFKYPRLGWFVAVAISLTTYAFVFFTQRVIRSLMLDSSISFEVSHFYEVTVYSILGLFATVVMLFICALIVFMANVQISALVPNRVAKYALLVASAATFLAIRQYDNASFAVSVLGAAFLMTVLLDVPALEVNAQIFKPRMVIWGLLLCVVSTLLINYYNDQKERVTRLAFVEQHLAPQRDDLVEFNFDSKARKIILDKTVKDFFYKPNLQARKALTQYLESKYLTGSLDKYQVSLYLYSQNYADAYNADTLSGQVLLSEIAEASTTNSPFLFYRESLLDRHYYLSHLPVYSDTVNTVIGHLFVKLTPKKPTTEAVYPELLQPQGHKAGAAGEHEYAYAVYVNGRLINQYNDYPFAVAVPDTMHGQQYLFARENGLLKLYYKIADKRLAIVVHYHNEFMEAITLFSYLFGISIIIAVLVILYQVYLRYITGKFRKGNYIRLTLRRRVHLSMLVAVFVSFIIIGYATIMFFSNEYRNTNNEKLQAAMGVARQSVQDYLAAQYAYNNSVGFGLVGRSTSFKSFIASLANSQKVDINIYDVNGDLLNASQEEAFDKGLISRKIWPEAYYKLFVQGTSQVIQNEHVGRLRYTSAYQPLRDERGATLGYINVPFFSSEKDLDFQISNIVITLINLYAFIFLISSLITVIVTRWMTSTFNIIIRQFDKLNLQKNERIDWPYNDEVGMLVREYNKMVNKVEENAARLAQSERETAWREMARQVAHEIKNPLTPMKLNIQYLQQAISNNHPDIPTLIQKVSASIIEQIDNLSYIASEFSNFAKLPEAKPELLNMGIQVKIAAELFSKQPGLQLTLHEHDTDIVVQTDKSQLLRVLTNLLQNAQQAIPQERAGRIDIHVRKQDDMVVLAITDNGTGIPDDVAPRMFQPYFTTKSSGTGLGLAMTKKIIEFWNGRIWFETELGTGTTFYISLPVM